MDTAATCQHNGAKGAGAPRFDPRYDCAAAAVWHLRLVAAAAELVTDRGADVLACEDHAMAVYYSIAMRHRVEPACLVPGAQYSLARNRCQPAV